MNTMLEPRMVAARIHGPSAVTGRWHEPARIAASSQGGLAMPAILHSPSEYSGSKRIHRNPNDKRRRLFYIIVYKENSTEWNELPRGPKRASSVRTLMCRYKSGHHGGH